MAYVTTLSAGVVYTLVQNTIYALPVAKVAILSDTALEQNVTNGTTGWTALASSTTGTETAAPFVRCTTGAAVVSVKYLR